MIKFRCEQCGKKIGVPNDQSGRRTTCPYCRSVNGVPDVAGKRDRDRAAARSSSRRGAGYRPRYLTDHRSELEQAEGEASAGHSATDLFGIDATEGGAGTSGRSAATVAAARRHRRKGDPMPMILAAIGLVIAIGVLIGVIALLPNDPVPAPTKAAVDSGEELTSRQPAPADPPTAEPKIAPAPGPRESISPTDGGEIDPIMADPVGLVGEVSDDEAGFERIRGQLPSVSGVLRQASYDRSRWLLAMEDHPEHRRRAPARVLVEMGNFLSLHNRPSSDLYPQAWMIDHHLTRVERLFQQLRTVSDGSVRFLYEPGEMPLVFARGTETMTAMLTGVTVEDRFSEQAMSANERAMVIARTVVLPMLPELVRAFDESRVTHIGVVVNYGTKVEMDGGAWRVYPEAAAVIVSVPTAKRFAAGEGVDAAQLLQQARVYVSDRNMAGVFERVRGGEGRP